MKNLKLESATASAANHFFQSVQLDILQILNYFTILGVVVVVVAAAVVVDVVVTSAFSVSITESANFLLDYPLWCENFYRIKTMSIKWCLVLSLPKKSNSQLCIRKIVAVKLTCKKIKKVLNKCVENTSNVCLLFRLGTYHGELNSKEDCHSV